MNRKNGGENAKLVRHLRVDGRPGGDAVYLQRKVGRKALRKVLAECGELQTLEIKWVKDLRLKPTTECQGEFATSRSITVGG